MTTVLRKAFDEADHPRGQPENAGQFAPSEGASAAVEKAKEKVNQKEEKPTKGGTGAAKFTEKLPPVLDTIKGHGLSTTKAGPKSRKAVGEARSQLESVLSPKVAALLDDIDFAGIEVSKTGKVKADAAGIFLPGGEKGERGWVGVNESLMGSGKKSGAYADSSPAGKVRHEIGHAVEHLLPNEEMAEIRRALLIDNAKWFPSMYGEENNKEKFAEFFALVTKPGFELDSLPESLRVTAARLVNVPEKSPPSSARYAEGKAFDPSQPRDPAGSETGGQFASEGARAAVDKARSAAAKPRNGLPSDRELASAEVEPLKVAGAVHGEKLKKVSVGGRSYFFKPAGASEAAREEATSELAALAGVNVPASRKADVGGAAGVLSDFAEGVTGDKDKKAFYAAVKADPARASRLAAFHYLVGAEDRHAGNYLVGGGEITSLDHSDSLTNKTPKEAAALLGQDDLLAAMEEDGEVTFDRGAVKEVADKASAMADKLRSRGMKAEAASLEARGRVLARLAEGEATEKRLKELSGGAKSFPHPARRLAARYAEALGLGQDAAAFILGKAFAAAYPELELCVKQVEDAQGHLHDEGDGKFTSGGGKPGAPSAGPQTSPGTAGRAVEALGKFGVPEGKAAKHVEKALERLRKMKARGEEDDPEADVDEAFGPILDKLGEKYVDAELERLAPGDVMPPGFGAIAAGARKREVEYRAGIVKELVAALGGGEKSLTVCSSEPPGVGWTYSGAGMWTKAGEGE